MSKFVQSNGCVFLVRGQDDVARTYLAQRIYDRAVVKSLPMDMCTEATGDELHRVVQKYLDDRWTRWLEDEAMMKVDAHNKRVDEALHNHGITAPGHSHGTLHRRQEAYPSAHKVQTLAKQFGTGSSQSGGGTYHPFKVGDVVEVQYGTGCRLAHVLEVRLHGRALVEVNDGTMTHLVEAPVVRKLREWQGMPKTIWQGWPKASEFGGEDPFQNFPSPEQDGDVLPPDEAPTEVHKHVMGLDREEIDMAAFASFMREL